MLVMLFGILKLHDNDLVSEFYGGENKCKLHVLTNSQSTSEKMSPSCIQVFKMRILSLDILNLILMKYEESSMIFAINHNISVIVVIYL